VWTRPSWTVSDAGVPFVPWANTPPYTDLTDAGVPVTREVRFRDSLRLAPSAELTYT